MSAECRKAKFNRCTLLEERRVAPTYTLNIPVFDLAILNNLSQYRLLEYTRQQQDRELTPEEKTEQKVLKEVVERLSPLQGEQLNVDSHIREFPISFTRESYGVTAQFLRKTYEELGTLIPQVPDGPTKGMYTQQSGFISGTILILQEKWEKETGMKSSSHAEFLEKNWGYGRRMKGFGERVDSRNSKGRQVRPHISS